jgi:hypothetical protein
MSAQSGKPPSKRPSSAAPMRAVMPRRKSLASLIPLLSLPRLAVLLKPASPGVAVSLCLLLAGCTTTSMSATGLRAQCAPWRAIYWSRGDTANTVHQVRVHNLTGQKVGCWK